MERRWKVTIGARRARLLLLLAAVGAASAVATVKTAYALEPGRGLEDPVVFLRGVVREIAANDYAIAWQALSPAQQRLVQQGEYVRCESASPIPGELTSLDVLGVADERVRVAGTSGQTPSKAVTFRIAITEPSLHATEVVVHTVHAVRTGDHWAWILPAARLRLDSSRTCGEPPRIP